MAAKCILTPDYEEEGKEESREVREMLNQQSTYVKLNVGGALFTTTIGTLTKYDNMLRAMFSGRMDVQTDEQGTDIHILYSTLPPPLSPPPLPSLGWVLIDRSGKHFGAILNFLRDGSVSLPDKRKECMEMLAEAK